MAAPLRQAEAGSYPGRPLNGRWLLHDQTKPVVAPGRSKTHSPCCTACTSAGRPCSTSHPVPTRLPPAGSSLQAADECLCVDKAVPLRPGPAQSRVSAGRTAGGAALAVTEGRTRGAGALPARVVESVVEFRLRSYYLCWDSPANNRNRGRATLPVGKAGWHLVAAHACCFQPAAGTQTAGDTSALGAGQSLATGEHCCLCWGNSGGAELSGNSRGCMSKKNRSTACWKLT